MLTLEYGHEVKGLSFLTLQRGNAFLDALRHTRLRSLHHAEFNPRRLTAFVQHA
ncbi:DUF1534 domain-containing protein [Pseudomonas syringae]|uniref:DUF1534 domain-containing protein n=1 Tax=Pseudomonas syringae UB303 TaxID=1357287 RepID=A0AAJ4B1Q2_PSESX|nr:DUF1534 domain-containing protein [Pseudomonas syringae]QHF10151.1 DUF1534 domain-containing protein [Pseudomonas syringae UB303]